MSTEDLRYPIGKFQPKEVYSETDLKDYIQTLAAFPNRLRSVVEGLTPLQLQTPYREEGWTVQQTVHHLADSHLHAYIRTKWLLTEDTPTIKAYLEKRWAETPENESDIQLSLALIHAHHAKWVALLGQLPVEAFQRQFYHPDSKKHVRLDTLVATYAWHGEHHAMHIQRLKERLGW
jgi:hypothetical protein